MSFVLANFLSDKIYQFFSRDYGKVSVKWYTLPQGVDKNAFKQKLEQVARDGNTNAEFFLSLCYKQGLCGFGVDNEQAQIFLQKVRDKGEDPQSQDADALYILSQGYHCLNSGVAFSALHKEYFNALELHKARGDHFQHLRRSWALREKSAALGNPHAQWLRSQELRAQNKNYLKFVEAAARDGDLSGNSDAQWLWSQMLPEQHGGSTAYHLKFVKAAARIAIISEMSLEDIKVTKIQPPPNSNALWLLYSCYRDGRNGLQKDRSLEKKCLHLAAIQGHPQAKEIVEEKNKNSLISDGRDIVLDTKPAVWSPQPSNDTTLGSQSPADTQLLLTPKQIRMLQGR